MLFLCQGDLRSFANRFLFLCSSCLPSLLLWHGMVWYLFVRVLFVYLKSEPCQGALGRIGSGKRR